MDKIKKEILLTKDECVQLANMLIKQANRCNANAYLVSRHYSPFKVQAKEKFWRKKAEELTALANKLIEPWNIKITSLYPLIRGYGKI